MSFDTKNPLIIQSDGTILLEADNPKFTEARDLLSGFAHLEKCPEYIHTYSITPLSFWNAKTIGLSAQTIIASLEKYTKYPIPSNVISQIEEISGRFGKIELIKENGRLKLCSVEPKLLASYPKTQVFAII